MAQADTAQVERVLARGEAKLREYAHPDPYIGKGGQLRHSYICVLHGWHALNACYLLIVIFSPSYTHKVSESLAI